MAFEDKRRVYRREVEPNRQLKIIVNGTSISTENWSMGGFRCYELSQYAKKDRFEGEVVRHDGEPDIPFTGHVIRVENDGARIVRLVEIQLDDLLTLQESTLS